MKGYEKLQKLVERGYDAVAEAYAGLETEDAAWPRMRHLRELLSLLPSDGDVLDLGCGNGVPEMVAIQERQSVVGVDVSAGQIDRARENVPGASLIQGDMLDLSFDEASFDAIVSFYAIEHVPREEHGSLFERFYGWLRPGGRLLFTLEAGGDEPGRIGAWLGVPMFFSYYDADATTTLLEHAGFVVERREVESQLEGGREIEYVWFHARKPPSREAEISD